MTAVEFYDRTPIENVISALTTRPDKIIFIGENSQMKDFDALYLAFLEQRQLEDIQVEYQGINRHDINGIAQKLEAIVLQEEECLFDLTGGDDLTLVAMGMVYQKYKDTRRIFMQRCNVNNGRVVDCDNDGQVVYTGTPTVTVDELIALHGGGVRYGDVTENFTFRWDVTAELMQDVDVLWDICREDPGTWNVCLTALGDIDPATPFTTTVTSSLPRVAGRLASFSRSMDDLNAIMYRIQAAGIIANYSTADDLITFCCKDMQIKRLLEKAGTVLEMKVYTTALRILDKDGTPYYTDGMSGVFIDWDGAVDTAFSPRTDTGNEIDVVLLKGLAPVFVSCKNGTVNDDELYKLSAVTSRFGSRYAKKALVATYLNKREDSLQNFRQRTRDMGIRFEEGVHLMDSDEFEEMVKRLIRSN